MGLPKIDQPLFPITIPSTGKKTTFRPFTVKEEKILLIAQESKDVEQVSLAVKQIITNCVTKVNVAELAVFDVEFLLLQIRAKAADNIVEFKIKDPDTEEEIPVKIDIEKIRVEKSEEHNNVIAVSDDINLIMKYPTFDYISSLADSDNTDQFKVMTDCIERVMQGEELYEMDDFSDEEKEEFIDSLNTKALKGIKDFFETMPKVRHEYKYKDNTGKEKTYVLEGTESFFM